MLNNQDYSIKETSAAWGIDLENNASNTSLKYSLEKIKEISNRVTEVSVSDPSGKSTIYTTGEIKQPVSNGHLILNPNGIDLRIIPGEIKSVKYTHLEGNRYKAIFKNDRDDNVLSISFNSDKSIDVNQHEHEIVSIKSKMKKSNTDDDIETLWRNMTDIHHFYPMLQQLGISKLDAFKAVPDELAYQVDINSLMPTLQNIQQNKEKIMVFIGNESVIQIYTGEVEKAVEVMNNKMIVIHGKTNEGNNSVVRISKDNIGEAWVVHKNSSDGFITSLEIFDANANHIAQLYGLRSEGQEQSPYWKKLMSELPKIM